jgi:hypothetical protein
MDPADSSHRTTGWNPKFCSDCGSKLARMVNTYNLGFDDLFDVEIERLPKEERDQIENAFYKGHVDDDESEYLIPSSTYIFGTMIGDDEGAFEYNFKGTYSDPDVVADFMKQEIALLKKYLYTDVVVRFGYLSTWD